MTVRFTKQGCRVETTYTIQPNGTYTEAIELSVEPGSRLALAVEETAGRELGLRIPPRGSSRVRSTRFGFELVPL
jgi:hypothetical protein